MWSSPPSDLRHPAVAAAASSYDSGSGSGGASADPGAAARVFARLRRGHLPVMGARVFARVSRVGGRTGDSVVRLELLDDGRAAPDTLGNDGIYSGYVTSSVLRRSFGQDEVPGLSLFAVSVTAINGGGARVPKGTTRSGKKHLDVPSTSQIRPSSAPFGPPCCGSSIPYLDAEAAGAFVRHAAGNVFAFDLGPPSLLDSSPPSRILDLRLEGVHRRSYGVWVASLTWTSTGDDLADGKGEVKRHNIAFLVQGAKIFYRTYQNIHEESRDGKRTYCTFKVILL